MKILHVIHDFLPRHRAGSELYAYYLAQAQRPRHQVEVLCAEYDGASPHGQIRRRELDGLPITELNNLYRFSRFEQTYAGALESSLDQVLQRVAPEVLHIHNLLNLSLRLPALARARGIKVVCTLHDYTWVCPSGGQRLHQAERHVCRQLEPARCARCFRQSPFYSQLAASGLALHPRWLDLGLRAVRQVGRRVPRAYPLIQRALAEIPQVLVTSGDIEARLAAAREAFASVDRFVAPSASLAAEYRRLGVPAHKLTVSDYGFVPWARSPTPRERAPGKLRLGFVGTLVWHKGVHVLLQALRALPPERYQLQVFGDLDTFPPYVAQLRALAAGLPVEFHGGFDHAQAEAVYRQFDVLVVPSLWLENSPLVIHEAFMAGIPVVGARSGGIADLVADGRWGLLYDAEAPHQLAGALRRLLEEPGLWERLAREVPKVKSMEEDAREWDRRYQGGP